MRDAIGEWIESLDSDNEEDDDDKDEETPLVPGPVDIVESEEEVEETVEGLTTEVVE